MNNIFDDMLVSSPNSGGLFFLHEGKVFKLDNFDTTGLSVKGKKVLRGIQPSALQLYDTGLIEITKSTVLFDDIHDVYLDDQLVYVVETSANAIIKLNSCGEELQRWEFPGEKDSLHINCLAIWNGKTVFSAFGEFTEHRGYKGKTEKSGFVEDLYTGQRLITGLSQPHSLVPVGQNLLLANSEKKELSEYGPSGDLVRTLTLDGYTRGICVVNNTMYVGLSCSRNIKCTGDSSATIVALDRDSWEEIGRIHVPAAEIYAIQGITNRDDVIHLLANITSDSASRLASAVSERDGQITSLNQAINERENQIVSFNQSVAERDGQIVNLNQNVIERDDRIKTLQEEVEKLGAWGQTQNRIILEREGRIKTLQEEVEKLGAWGQTQGKIILEREGRIKTLQEEVEKLGAWGQTQGKIILERDDRIKVLQGEVGKLSDWGQTQNKTILERDGQITSLNQDVVEQDEALSQVRAELEQSRGLVAQKEDLFRKAQIHINNQVQELVNIREYVNQKENYIHELTSSLSWKITKPVRFIGRPIVLIITRIKQAQVILKKILVWASRFTPLFKLKIHNMTLTPAHEIGETEGRFTSAGNKSSLLLSSSCGKLPASWISIAYVAKSDEVKLKPKLYVDDGRGFPVTLYIQLPEIKEFHNNYIIHLPDRVLNLRLNPTEDKGSFIFRDVKIREIGYFQLIVLVTLKALRRVFLRRASIKSVWDNLIQLINNNDVSGLQKFIFYGTYPVNIADSGEMEWHFDLDATFLLPELESPQKNLRNYSADSIKLKTSSQPVVSVIIPIYGKCDCTLRCLASIAANSPSMPFEVIVVDDNSPDNSAKVLKEVKGIQLISNTGNQGFIRSCNRGAKEATGQYLYFMNNDTEVTPGWLDELLRTFREFPGTGLAGSKLIYPDGRLQEAGGIIWQDGSAWNFGRFQDPLLPVYNYAREVDYCSGASIMVPKVLFDEFGGFDEHYLPAYCEDCDLALKIRDKGYRVIYQPLSIVIHYEGVTSGTDTSQGTKAYQIENSKKLFERWKRRLQTHQPAGMDVDNAKDRRATRRVLVIDLCTPTPNQDSGSIDAFNILLLLREMDFQVTFIPEDNFLYMPGYTPALQRAGIEVLYAPYCTSVEEHLKQFGGRYDLAFLFRTGVVDKHLNAIRKHCPKAKVLFHTVDLHHVRMSREAQLFSDAEKQRAADKMKATELAAICSVDVATVISIEELKLMRSNLPNERIHLLPFSRNIRGTDKRFNDRCDIVFVGGYQHPPNVDAVQYFVAEIMPLLRRHLPGVRFYAVGSNPPAEIQALASNDVIITGFVEDLTFLLDKMRVSVAPLRYGAGIKGKIGTAMAVGLPTVATPLAAEGMGLTPGENILVADGAEVFASAIAKIYQNETLWNRISHNGLEFADKAWGAESVWGILSGILADLGIKTIRRTYPLSLYSELESSRAEELNMPRLNPIASVKSREEFEQTLKSDSLAHITCVEKKLIDSSNTEAFSVDGFCVPCGKKVSFLVDMQSGGQRKGTGWIPNWRERLVCPLCRMKNRQRMIAALVKQRLDGSAGEYIYFMEQFTPLYVWAVATFKNHSIVGSEYFGPGYESGATIKGIRHENVENLSFTDNTLDLIVSNDVFEHVPNPARAFRECARVLRPGGIMLATIPFHCSSDESITRTKINDGQLEHVLPPSYHGNPVCGNGSLVFTDFGWDVLKEMQAAGFSDVSVEIYASDKLGHLGGSQLIFRLTK